MVALDNRLLDEAPTANDDIPFGGQPIPYETDDNISSAALGLPPAA
jgi:hypothetical protein